MLFRYHSSWNKTSSNFGASFFTIRVRNAQDVLVKAESKRHFTTPPNVSMNGFDRTWHFTQGIRFTHLPEKISTLPERNSSGSLSQSQEPDSVASSIPLEACAELPSFNRTALGTSYASIGSSQTLISRWPEDQSAVEVARSLGESDGPSVGIPGGRPGLIGKERVGLNSRARGEAPKVCLEENLDPQLLNWKQRRPNIEAIEAANVNVQSLKDHVQVRSSSPSTDGSGYQASTKSSPSPSFSELQAPIDPLYPVLPIPRDDSVSNSPGRDHLTPGQISQLDLDGSFYTPLGYHIPEKKLQEAINAPSTSIASYWQYTLYQGPGSDGDKVKVYYCKTKATSERVAQLFVDEPVLGFDIEWKKNAAASEGISKNVSLIQLASESRIALFHIARFSRADNIEEFTIPSLKKIMEDRRINKVGVAVKGDCTRLRRYLNIESQGIFELSHLYKLVKFSSGDVKKINKMLVSLAQQVEEHLGLPLWKGEEVRSGDWDKDLDYKQIQYAASDSYAGFQLYHILEAKRKNLIPTPPRPAHAELDLPIRLANGQTVAAWNETVDATEEPDMEIESDTDISVNELAHDFTNFEIGSSNLEGTGSKTGHNEKKFHSANLPSASAASSSPVSASLPVTKRTPIPSYEPPQQACVVRANKWVAAYSGSISKSRKIDAKPADLRAYYLWHHERLPIREITRVYHGKQLELSTVVAYIFNAIRLENLPFDRGAAWALVPHGVNFFRSGYKRTILTKYPLPNSEIEPGLDDGV